MFGRRSGRWLALGMLLLASLALASCGAPGVNVHAMIDEFGLYERDVKALDPQAPAAQALRTAQAHRDVALPLADKGGKAAAAEMDSALADVRLALASARADRAAARADECNRTVEQAWQGWQEALLMLEQVERVAARTAPDVPRTMPDSVEAAGDALALPEADAPDALTGGSAWLLAARDAGVSTGDLESRFSERQAAANEKGTSPEDRARNLYVARRAVEELVARVREQQAVNQCARAVAASARFADARERALRATIELERGLKDNLRAELETARTEARDRQTELYDSLRKLEGKFATITRNARGTIVSLADILFDFNKATLKRDVEFNLVKIATILEQFPEMKIQIEGHTDNVGTAAYNQDLSERRAQSVRDFLVTQGVTADRLTVAGYGLTRPVADNTTEAGRQKNRRVDLVIPNLP